MSRQSCSGLEVGKDIVLCSVEVKWDKTVADIRFGEEALCPALQNFLMSFGRTMERAGETVEIDGILAAVGVARLPDKKGLTEIDDQGLRVMEKRWEDLARDVRAEAADFSLASQEFVRVVGRFLVSQIVKRSSAEKQQLMMQNFYRSLKAGGVYIAEKICIPVPPCADEQIEEWFALGENLIYQPSEEEVPTAKLMAALPHQLMDDPEKIIWEPVREGRWLLVDAREHCPRIGERSFRGYSMALKRGQRIITLPQYAILWHVGSAGGEILDLETDTLLATRYGADSVMHAFGKGALKDLRFSVGEWRHTTKKHPKMGVRLVEIIA